MGQADNPALGLRRVLLHQRSGILRMEGVLHVDGDAFGHHRLDGGRVNDLGSKVGQFLCGAVGDVGNGAGGRRHLGVGGHDAGNIRPDFLAAGMDAHGEEGGGVVRSAAAQRGGTAFLVTGDEARDNEQLGVQVLLDAFLDAFVGDGGIHCASAKHYQFAGIQPLTGDAQRLALFGKNTGTEQFSKALYGRQAGGGEFSQQVNTPQDAGELGKMLVDNFKSTFLIALGEQFLHKLVMPLLKGLQAGFVTLVAGTGQAADGNELVGAAANGRTHHDGAVRIQGLPDYVDHLEHGSGIGNRAAAELKYLHGDYIIRADNLAISRRKPSWPKWELISIKRALGIQALHSRPSKGGKRRSVSTATMVQEA